MRTKLFLTVMAALLITTIGTFWPGQAKACCSCRKETQRALDDGWYNERGATVKTMVSYFEGEFTGHKQFIVGLMWEDNILPAMMLMTEQLSAVAMQQMQIIGTFFDAKLQMEAQQLFQVEQAKIRKAYQPSQGLCEFGTSVKSLVASDRRSEINAIALSQRAQDRDLGNAYSSAYSGPVVDKKSRLAQFKLKFCDTNNNNNGLESLCEDHSRVAERLNKDIDFVRTMDDPWTINLNFIDTKLTNNEEEILALSSNLYGHQLIDPPPSVKLANSGDGLTAVQETYMNARAIMAKRSVARNSFNALAALKSPGTPGSREFLVNILTDLGVSSPEEAKIMLGDYEGSSSSSPINNGSSANPSYEIEPSYNAQMEVLTKKLYQNPQFYTNLYDTPANVDRKSVAMQAIGLMQKFDVFKSYLRHEASVSMLLELAVADMQDSIENDDEVE